jgi:hypothetical protein
LRDHFPLKPQKPLHPTATVIICYVVNKCGIEWTFCEVPSMMPTIKTRGAIILIDWFTPLLWGLQVGETTSKRTALARALYDRRVLLLL